MASAECSDCINCDLCCLILRKSKHTCWNTAECNAFDFILYSKFKAGVVAALEELAMPVSKCTLYNRSHGVYNIIAWQIVWRRDFSISYRFFMSLCLHKLSAFVTQTNTSKRVNTVVDTAVAWLPAASHSGIGCVDNSTAFQCGNIAFPEVNTVLHRL